MRSQPRCASIVAVAGAAVPLFLAASAFASVPGTVIQTRRNLNNGAESSVPGLPAATMALAQANGVNIVWNEPTTANPGFSSNNGTPVIDANGNIFFVGTMATATYVDPDTLATTYLTGVTSNFSATGNSNNRAIFRATASSGWANSGIQIVARDGSSASPASQPGTGTPATDATLALLGGPTPGGIGANVLNGSNNAGGLAAGISVSSNGIGLFNSLVAPVGGTNVGASFFTGQLAPGNAGTQSGINGAALSGTSGATLSLTSSQVVNSLGINTSGQFAFAATTAGGDTVTSGTQQNNTGLWLFSSSGNTKVYRRGEAAPGVTDGTNPANYAFGAAVTANNVRINSAGSVLFNNVLANTAATTPTGFSTANAAQAGVLYYKTSAGAPQLVAQTGTPIGTTLPGAVYANNSSFAVGQQMLNNSGKVVFNAKFNASNASSNPSSAGANIQANINDQAIVGWDSITGPTVLFQTGVTPVPGVGGATFKDLNFSNTQTRLNNLNHFAFAAAMTDNGTTIVPASTGVSGNDNGLWLGNAAGAGLGSLIARAGDVAPGYGGLVFGNSFFGVIMNNVDQIIFQNTLTDGLGHNAQTGVFAYGSAFGLVNLFGSGDTSLLGANYPLGSNPASYNSNSNGDGGVLGLNDNGQFTFFANSSGIGGAFGANNVLMVMQIPAPGTGMLAFVGIGLAARRRRR